MTDSTYFVNLTLCRYVTDIFKMCMKKFDAEKMFFDTPIGFLT